MKGRVIVSLEPRQSHGKLKVSRRGIELVRCIKDEGKRRLRRRSMRETSAGGRRQRSPHCEIVFL